MKTAIVTGLVVALLVAPYEANAQRGGGSNSRGGGRPGGGGQGSGRPGGAQNRGAWQGGGQDRGGWQGGRGAPNSQSARPQGSLSRQGGNRQASNARPGPSRPQDTHQSLAGHSQHFDNRNSFHGSWHHGDWHYGNWNQGHWHGYGHPWAYRPYGWYWGGGWGWGFAAGVATVGVVSAASPWGWGYYSYYNPYWVAPVGVTYINYSQPVVAAAPAVQAPTIAAAAPRPAAAALPGPSPDSGESIAREKALTIFENARGLFKRGDYQLALAETNRAVALVPNDSLMHEFRALCLFALADYKQSAAAMYAVLATGPGWDEATLKGLYSNPDAYNQQLRALEDYRDDHAQAADARFLLAYHYTLANRNDEAAAELARVVELEPKDQLAAQLLRGLTPTSEEPPQTGPALLPGEPVEASRLVGDWKANRDDGSKFELSLRGDNRFRWKFNQSEKNQEFSGTYTLADNYLILTATGQNTLVGHVALESENRLQFTLAGGGPSDPGLVFTR